MPRGLVGQLRSKRNLTRLMQYSAQLYGKARGRDRPGDGMEAGRQPAARLVGGALERAQAHGDDRAQLRLRAAYPSPKEPRRKFPLMDPTGVIGAVFVPNDGSVEPSSLTMAYAKARGCGAVRIVEGVLVTGFESREGASRAC